MHKRTLGKTGLKVSVIGLGGIPIQRVTQDVANEIINACIKEGINFIDSARGYGESEKRIGSALLGKRDAFYIATKSPAKTKSDMAKAIDESLLCLQTNYIDLYQCHYVKDRTQYDIITGQGGAYEALKEAKEAGKIGHIGITAHSKDVLLHAIETGLWETIQFPYNFVETQGTELFKRAHALGIGILIMKPLAGGAIQDIPLAFKFIINNPDITTAIPGMESEGQVLENASLGNKRDALDTQEIAYIKSFREKMGNDFCRRCGYCSPCPVDIDIPLTFTLNSYVTRYKLKAWGTERYNTLKVKASDCIECGVCETKCPYDLNIREKLKSVVTTFGS